MVLLSDDQRPFISWSRAFTECRRIIVSFLYAMKFIVIAPSSVRDTCTDRGQGRSGLEVFRKLSQSSSGRDHPNYLNGRKKMMVRIPVVAFPSPTFSLPALPPYIPFTFLTPFVLLYSQLDSVKGAWIYIYAPSRSNGRINRLLHTDVVVILRLEQRLGGVPTRTQNKKS